MTTGGLGGYKANGGYGANPNQSRFYKISGYVKQVFYDERSFYLSCPECRKKVIEQSFGMYKCDHCDKTFKTNVPTYMLSAVIADVSGNVIVQFPRELGDPIMDGLSASEFKKMKEEQSEDEVKEFVK